MGACLASSAETSPHELRDAIRKTYYRGGAEDAEGKFLQIKISAYSVPLR